MQPGFRTDPFLFRFVQDGSLDSLRWFMSHELSLFCSPCLKMNSRLCRQWGRWSREVQSLVLPRLSVGDSRLPRVISLRRDNDAERQGFEPWEQLPVHRISSAARSTTPASFLNSAAKLQLFLWMPCFLRDLFFSVMEIIVFAGMDVFVCLLW